MLPKKWLVIIGTTSGVLSIFLIGLFLLSTLGFLGGKPNLTDEEKQKILSEIIKNNSSNVLGKNGASGAQDTSLAPNADKESMLTAPLIARPNTQDYKYRYSKIVYSNGPAIGQCKFFDINDAGAYTSESYEYYGDGNTYDSKYITKDSDNDLTSYSLTRTNTNNSETVIYSGGSYAVRTSYTFSDLLLPENSNSATENSTAPNEPTTVQENDSTSTDQVSGDLIAQFFGPDADVVNIITENGKDYYVVQYSYNVDCSIDAKILPYTVDSIGTTSLNSTSQNQTTNKIFAQNIVDSTNFQIIRSYNYLGSVSDNNLLNSYQTTIQESNPAFEDVSNNFKFDYNVDIKDVVYPPYTLEQQTQNIIDYLTGKKLTLIVSDISGSTLTSAYSYEASRIGQENADYIYDRNFYPQGAKGDKLFAPFKDSQNLYPNPIVSLSYLLNQSSTYDLISINAYENNIDSSKILYTTSDTKKSDMNINIDGVNQKGTLYTTSYNAAVNTSDSSTEVTPPSSGSTYSTKQLYIEFKGIKYIISFPTRTDFDLNNLKFKTISTTNSTQMSDLKTQINNVYNGSGAGVSGSGSSSSGSAGTPESIK